MGASRVMLPDDAVEAPLWCESTSFGAATERLEITVFAAIVMDLSASKVRSAPLTVIPEPLAPDAKLDAPRSMLAVTLIFSGSMSITPAAPPPVPSARSSPPANSMVFLALNSTKPPSPDAPALASSSEPARLTASLSAQETMLPPDELLPLPRAISCAPACKSILPPAWRLISPALTPAAPGVASVPSTVTSPAATMRMRPASTITLPAEAMPLALTTSVKFGAVPMNRAPANTVPPTLTVPADSVTPSVALTLPWIDTNASGLIGAVPDNRLVTKLGSAKPGNKKKLLTYCGVGVTTFKLPRLTVPPAPTTSP